MRLRRDRIGLRLGGTVLGVGFIFVGGYAVAGSDAVADAYARDRSLWFGITAILAGVAALIASWAARDPRSVWCAHPPRHRSRHRAP